MARFPELQPFGGVLCLHARLGPGQRSHDVGVKSHQGHFLLSLKEQKMHLEPLHHGVLVKSSLQKIL